MFHCSKVQSKSEIVYTECLSPATAAESFIDNDEENFQSSQDSDSASEIDAAGYGNKHDKAASLTQ